MTPPHPDQHKLPELPNWSRRAFLSTGVASVALLLAGCSSEPTSFDGTVIIVGAGPAGMTAAHLLRQRGVAVEVLEAGPTHGGRIRHNLDFADFPISLGGEWVHVDGSILDEIINDDEVESSIELVDYRTSDEVAYVDDGVVSLGPLIPEVFDGDTKFLGSSWLDFFERHVVPNIEDTIRYATQVVEIDHSGGTVTLTDSAGETYVADRVVVTVPLRILQLGDISFVPPLEEERLEVIDRAKVWSGLKAFFEFDEKFYPAAVAFADSETEDGQRLFYDAAYGQDSDQHILGLFSVGVQAETYQAMSDDELVADVLAELDEAFGGAASRHYVRHLVQNWNDEPFARGAYLEDNADSGISARLSRPVGQLLHFAGDAYTAFDDWSSVHTAARSAADAVERILR